MEFVWKIKIWCRDTLHSQPSHFIANNRKININSFLLLLIQETSINLFTVLQMNFDFWWFQIAKSLKFFFWKIHRIWCAEIRIKNDFIETFVLCIYLFYKSIVLYISSSFVMVFPMSKWQKMLVLFQKFGLNENWMLWKSNEKNTTRICC